MTRSNISFSTRLQRKQYFTAASMMIEDEAIRKKAMEQFFTGEWRENQQIANALQYVKKRKKQQLIVPYYPNWVKLLQHPPHDAFERNTYRYFENSFIPEEVRGKLFSHAINSVINSQKAIAIRAFAMGVCANIAEHHPDLLPELKEAIAIAQETESAGIQARVRNVLKQLA